MNTPCALHSALHTEINLKYNHSFAFYPKSALAALEKTQDEVVHVCVNLGLLELAALVLAHICSLLHLMFLMHK